LGSGSDCSLRAPVTARAEDKPPVLVGYVQKLLPDRDGGDREVGVEQAQRGDEGNGQLGGQ
jgi:hypothetical protein